jgi:hypothetical protein
MSWLALALAMGGCEGPQQPGNNPTPGPVLRSPDEALVQRIETMRERVLADSCFREQKDGETCDWVDHTYDPAEFAMEESTGEAILLVDTIPTLSPAMFRHRRRIQGYYRPTPEGTLAPVTSTWHLPATLHEVLDAFATPRFIPSGWLRPLNEPLHQTYRGSFAGAATHGNFVFSVLVESTPRQPLILLDGLGFESFAPDLFCDPSPAPETLAALRERSQRVADSLQRLMRERNVRFINYSAGWTLDSMRSDWGSLCKTPSPGDEVLRARLRTLEPIMEALFHTPGVFAANSAINATGEDDFPYDFPSERYANRLRVGFITALESGLDATGRGPHEGLRVWPASSNVDVYLNSGVLPERPSPYNRTPLLTLDLFGMDLNPITRTTTSWIAPLALSRFIFLRDGTYADREMSDELVATIIEHMVPSGCEDLPGGRCIYQDPLKHGQTEAIRLGYQPLEYVEP